ncbi:hypothetical protein P9J83_04470 [Clostridium sporogenes]|uniref:Uncharacterized protein n=1 Tax=Clostridium sporogenes TaxID=1509 RepID=A0AAE4FJX3_CLOSG|nr:hypothetical protein [Clostridium sporogenes]MDS1002757.1 hypothetical protein [Clostridium sporogenes]
MSLLLCFYKYFIVNFNHSRESAEYGTDIVNLKDGEIIKYEKLI